MTTHRQTALIIGATSDIGRAIARRLAGDGYALQLAGRSPQRLEREARDLRVRLEAAVTVHPCDVLDEHGGIAFLDDLEPRPDVAVLRGWPPRQARTKASATRRRRNA